MWIRIRIRNTGNLNVHHRFALSESDISVLKKFIFACKNVVARRKVNEKRTEGTKAA
jgi:hypothetical protein